MENSGEYPPSKRSRRQQEINEEDVKIEIKEETIEDENSANPRITAENDTDFTMKFESTEYRIYSEDLGFPFRTSSPGIPEEITEEMVLAIEKENELLLKQLIQIKNENQKLVQEQKKLKGLVETK